MISARPIAPRTAPAARAESTERRAGVRRTPADAAVGPTPPWCAFGRAGQYPRAVAMEPVVHLRAAVALLGRFPALAGVDLDVDAGRDRAPPRARTAPARPRCCARCAGPGPGRRAARPWCSATTCRRDRAGRCAAGSGCSATPPALRRPHRRPTTCASGPGPAGPATPTADAALDRLGLDGRLRDVAGGQAVGRPAPPRLARRACVARRPELWLLDEPHAGLDQPAATCRRPRPRRGRAGRDRGPRSPRARPGRGPGRPGRRRRRRHGRPAGPGAGCRVPPAPPARRDDPTPTGRGGRVFRDAALVAGKDLRIEARSRVALNQVAAVRPARPGAVRLRPRPRPRRPRAGHARACSGWRCCSRPCSPSSALRLEAADGNRDALRLSGLDPAGIFLGKVAGVAGSSSPSRSLLGVGRRRALRRRRRRASALLARHRAWSRPLRLAAAGTPLRRPRRRAAGPRDAAPAAAPAGARPGAHRRHPGLRGGPRPASRPRAGRGSACSPSSPSSTSRSGLLAFGPAPGGIVTTAARPGTAAGTPRPDPRHAGAPPRPARGAPGSLGLLALAGSRCWPCSAWSSRPPTSSRATPCGSVRPRAVGHRTCTSASSSPRWRSRPVAVEADRWWDLVAGAGGRDRRGVHRRSPWSPAALGPPDLGRLLGVGRPPHLHRAAVPAALGYLAVRRLAGRPRRARSARAAVVGLLLVAQRARSSTTSVDWWRTCTRARPSTRSIPRSRG